MQYLMMLTFPRGEGPQEGTPEFDAEMEAGASSTDEMRAAGIAIGASGLEIDAADHGARAGRRRHGDRRPVRRDEGDPVLLLHDRRRGSRRGHRVGGEDAAAEYGAVEIQPMVHYEQA